MAKIKFTKNELKEQRDNLKRFGRYLPTLELKKQQLLREYSRIQNAINELEAEIKRIDELVQEWVDVFADEVNLQDFFSVEEIRTEPGNIGGIDLPVFQEVCFHVEDYDLLQNPLWVDRGIEVVQEQIRLAAEVQVLHRQQEIIQEELRITSQRIKLFEEVEIPKAKENIRVIRIFLGDQMTADVVRGKIAKAKIERRRQRASQA